MEPLHYAGTDAIAKQEAMAARLVGMGVPADRAFCAATALKYVERCGRKRGASVSDDMEKAANYMFRSIEGRWPWEDAVEADHVLAADGLPLREGEHVYHVETGAELVVKELPKPGAYQAVVVFAPPASHLMMSFDPDRLTHQRPVADSWERLEEDAGKGACDYFGHEDDMVCRGCPASGKGCEETMARDLVRRARALAEKGER